MKWMAVIFVLLLSSCANREVKTSVSLDSARTALDRGQYQSALKQYRSYLQLQPQSQYFQAARAGEAEALEGLGQYTEALEIYRDVIKRTRQEFPDIAALALYRSSYSYEAAGNIEQAVSSLLDAQRLRKHLPVEVAEAEIPSRLGLLYAKLGQSEQARMFNQQALNGLERVREVREHQVWLAKTYYQMGMSSDNQISSDSLTQHMEALKWAQVYLLRAMKLNQDPWSERAYIHLKETYRAILLQIEGLSQMELLEKHGGELLSLMRQAEMYRPLETPTNAEKNFYQDLVEIQKRADALLLGRRLKNPMTLESEVLHGIKREGKFDSDSQLPRQKFSPIQSP